MPPIPPHLLFSSSLHTVLRTTFYYYYYYHHISHYPHYFAVAALNKTRRRKNSARTAKRRRVPRQTLPWTQWCSLRRGGHCANLPSRSPPADGVWTLRQCCRCLCSARHPAVFFQRHSTSAQRVHAPPMRRAGATDSAAVAHGSHRAPIRVACARRPNAARATPNCGGGNRGLPAPLRAADGGVRFQCLVAGAGAVACVKCCYCCCCCCCCCF